jgi:SAM-dependent methyltransferase
MCFERGPVPGIPIFTSSYFIEIPTTMPGIDIDDIYRNLAPEDIPWNRPELPAPLRELLDGGDVLPCRAVEFGCGMGKHAIEMARRGFEVTGVDRDFHRTDDHVASHG